MADAVVSTEVSSTESLKQQLRMIPLLSGLTSDVIDEIAPFFQLKQIPRGQAVVRKGGGGDQLLFVLNGRLQAIDLAEDGREIGLSFLLAGDYFGELSVIDGLPRSATVFATQNSLVAFLPRVHALDLIYKNPTVVESLLKKMAGAVRRLSDYQAVLSIPSAFHRVFSLLQQLVVMAPGGLVVIDNVPTQQEIAIMVNTSRETVSRAIRLLISKGIVEKDLRRLIIRKPDVLKKIYIDV